MHVLPYSSSSMASPSSPCLHPRGVACGAGHFYAINFPRLMAFQVATLLAWPCREAVHIMLAWRHMVAFS